MEFSEATTLSWCRSTRTSACNAARDRNDPTAAHQISLQRLPIARLLTDSRPLVSRFGFAVGTAAQSVSPRPQSARLQSSPPAATVEAAVVASHTLTRVDAGLVQLASIRLWLHVNESTSKNRSDSTYPSIGKTTHVRAPARSYSPLSALFDRPARANRAPSVHRHS
jgi:hypothetical protein